MPFYRFLYPNNCKLNLVCQLCHNRQPLEVGTHRPKVKVVVMSCLVKTNYSHQLSSTAMAMCSSFCPQIPNQLRTRPICPFPRKPLYTLSVKAFSSETSNASSKGTFFIYLYASLMGILIFRLNFCLSLELIEQFVWISDKIER